METKKNRKEIGLKHLGFVRMAAIHVLVCISNLYDYGKRNSGPLKSIVEKVEGAVATVATPVYQKVKNVPDTLLLFLDHKVDQASYKFDKHAPSKAKQVANQTKLLIKNATEKVQCFVNEARTRGPRAAFSYAATQYKYFLVTVSVKVWAKLNHYKPIHAVGGIAFPVVAKASRLYNDLVTDMTQMGYPVVGYLPLVPLDDIVKAYEMEEAAQKKKHDDVTSTLDGNKSSSDSDSD